MAAKQITVISQNRPGSMARITAALAKKGVNLNGIYASDSKGRGAVRLLVGNAARAMAALAAAGFRTREEPALVLSLPDKPGQLARTAAKLARKRINISYAYATVGSGSRRATIVLGVNNPASARRVLR